MLQRFLPLLLLFTIPATNLQGQVDTFSSKDDKLQVQYYTLNMLKGSMDSTRSVDTSLHLFHQFNPVYHFNKVRENLGNIHSPSFPLVFDPFTQVGFDKGFDPFGLYRLTDHNIKFYDTYTPYTKLDYSQGATKLQYLRGVHSRNITPHWNASLQFKRGVSDGFYFNQQSERTNIGINTRVKTENNRYEAHLSIIWNKFKANMNGGVFKDSVFRSYESGDKERIKVNLNEGTYQQWQERGINLTQFLFTGPEKIDTLIDPKPNDTFVNHHIKSDFYFKHSASFNRQQYGYVDKNPSEHTSYYPAIYNDSAATKDTMGLTHISTGLEFGNTKPLTLGNDSLPFLKTDFNTKIGYHIHDVYQGDKDSLIKNLDFKGQINTKLWQDFKIGLSGSVIPSGDNQGEWRFNGNVSFPLESLERITFGYRHQERQATLIQSTLSANHLKWDKDHNRISIRQPYIKLKEEDLNLTSRISYSSINGWVYWNKNINPTQYNQTINFFDINFKKYSSVGPFNFESNVTFQPEIKDLDILNFPDFVSRNTIYYQNEFIQDVLMAQIGFDYRINRAYYADDYFPAFNIFYNQSRGQVGNYPVIDVFINFRIKRFRGFFKLEHANQGIMGDNY
ncbi:MAG: hypothetical protein BRD49_03045, partial [Bacteroidetes bacterium SW_10_40_5]